ncbi:hypothetical protein [Ruminococcus sp.]|uniref:hypothetical protein n=1 Tax=Ruminococcus sp. TaxID=41978 RepID=UPI0025E14FBB|nr:hypothetical protein [Ruminococcus sp.]MBQ8966341.1 hypothetical protein [Ruminococcus sp.]
MTAKKMISALAEKYGDEFIWSPLADGSFFERQLVKESDIEPERITALAKCEANDDVLYHIGGEELPWRIYHLTYYCRAKYKGFSSAEEACDYIEKCFIEDYISI